MLQIVRRCFPAAILATILLLALASVALAAPANPTLVTSTSCAFSTQWFDGLSRWLFGLSLILLLLAGFLSLRNMHTEGPWGAIVGIAGVGILLGLVALLPQMAPIALAAAGAPACP